MTAPLRWGILGPGNIAGAFADDLRFVAAAQLVAVGSRDRERAVGFAARRAIPYAHGSYEALVNDANVDAIYVATPHTRHVQDALLCLRAGKHVLIEKPMALSATEARQVCDVAAGVRLFAMEAMWTRFFPLFEKVRELIIRGRIGSIVELRADLGHATPFDPSHRLWDPARGGGALLDIGVYPLAWAIGMLGWPTSFAADASFAPSGVDEATGMRLHHEGGAVSLLHASMRCRTPCQTVIDGTEGRIVVHGPMYAPRRISVSAHKTSTPSTWTRALADLDQAGSPLLGAVDRLPPTVLRLLGSGPARQLRNRVADQISRNDEPFVDLLAGAGYRYEAEEVARCVAAGRLESTQWPLADTVQMMALLDDVRKRIGLEYPSDGVKT